MNTLNTLIYNHKDILEALKVALNRQDISGLLKYTAQLAESKTKIQDRIKELSQDCGARKNRQEIALLEGALEIAI